MFDTLYWIERGRELYRIDCFTPRELALLKVLMLKPGHAVPKERLFPCTNCGMAPMSRQTATRKLEALGAGAKLARQRHG